MLPKSLSPELRQCWRDHGYVALRGIFDTEEQAQLRGWAEELEAWPETPGAWMKYFEPPSNPETPNTVEPRRLCRVENFLPHHPQLAAFFDRADVRGVLAELMGEPAVVFKEKINFKLPGGQGFTAHQDAPAFTQFGQRYHVTAMVAVDATTPANGCLEISLDRAPEQLLDQADDGTLAQSVIAALDWQPLEAQPGDLILFDSYMPHRSGPNTTTGPRRAYYVTFNRASDGDVREAYFARKRRAFPPECERVPGQELAPDDPDAAAFNLGNPIR